MIEIIIIKCFLLKKTFNNDNNIKLIINITKSIRVELNMLNTLPKLKKSKKN